MKTWLKHLQQQWQIPEIQAERCVHSQFATASCDACVDVCPHDAWVLDEEQLGINTERCNGCGLCHAACPESALLLEQAPPLREYEHKRLLFLACQHSGQKGHSIACLHALSDTQLLSYYEVGYRHWLQSACDCQGCENAPDSSQQLSPRLARLNQLLSSRELKPIQLFQLTTEAWQAYFDKSHSSNLSPSLSRRNFLKQAALALEKQVENETGNTPNLSIFTDDKKGGLYLYVPKFKDNCSACDACLKLCPHEVISLDKDQQRYSIAAEHCTACGLCVDVCTDKAIEISHLSPSDQDLRLEFHTCQRCGVPYHYLSAAQGNETYCQICSQTQGRQTLFSVYD